MKRKIGKIALGLMVMLLVAITLFVIFSSVRAVPIGGTYPERLGSFTGPVGGSAQDDNIKASLDLAHTDLDTGLANQEDIEANTGQGTGNIFYVDSSKSGTTGVSRALAVNDLEEVQALLAADNDDHVYIAAGHAETIGGAKAIDLDVAGVTYHFEGNGKNRPTFSYDTNVDSIAIGADDITIDGIYCFATVTAVANAFIIEAGVKGTIFENCLFENETAGTDEFIDTILISGTASDGTIIRNNVFVSDTSENAGPKSSINFVDCDLLQVYGNNFFGDAGDAHIFNETTASNYVVIRDNIIHQGAIGDAKLDTTPAISLVATTTGMIFDNTIATNTASKALAIVAADCHVFNNTYSEIQGSGTALEVGKAYVRISSEALTTAAAVDLFDVLGGRIEIISMMGQCTTVIGSTPGACSLIIDATTGDQDADFTTAVSIDALGVGDVVNFAAVTAGESVLVLDANENGALPVSWFCPIGMIEQKTATTGTGGITWYMVFRPLEDGVTVTVQ